MARTLYRIYLYVFTAVLLVFTVSVLGSFLGTALLYTPLRAPYEAPPDHTQVVQTSTLLAIAVIVALALGGLHYWLIRRDIAQDPDAARGPVRALVLNALQAGATPFALFSGIAIVTTMAGGVVAGTATMIAVLVPAVVVFALAQLESGRSRAAPGAALALQRLHVYFIQTVVLITGLIFLYEAVYASVRAALNGLGLTSCFEYDYVAQLGCDFGTALRVDWLTVLWVVAVWLVYLWLGRGDGRSVLRQIAQYFGFLLGIGFVVYGTERAAELVLRAALQVQVISPQLVVDQYDFLTPILVGLILLVGYGAALMIHAADAPLGRAGAETALLALTGAALALPFYTGIGLLLQSALESIVPGGHSPELASWATSGAIAVAGLAHPLVAYVLRLRGTAHTLAGPRRAYTFVLLAAGALTATLSGISLTYILVTALLGTPVQVEWQPLARDVGVVVAVSAFVAGIQLWRLLTERGPEARKPAPIPAPVMPAPVMPAPVAPAVGEPAASDPIAAIVDALLAGRLTHDQAVEALRRAIPSSPSSHSS